MKPHDTIRWISYPDMSDAERIAATKDFYGSIRTPRTYRSIGSRPLPREAIETAIMAAGTAPSGANHQPWHFVLVTSPAARHRIRIAAARW
ncbi:MAG: nitroreductase family protein [Sphingomonadales bacterium]